MTQIVATLTPHQQALRGKTIPDALDAAAQAWPDRPALHEIEGEKRSLTWSQVRTVTAAVRSGLETAGVRPGDKVGVIVRNQLEFPIAWLAIVEAGAAIVPLNPKYTAREIDFVLGDAGATWLIGTGDLLEATADDGRIGPVDLDHVVSIGAGDLAALSFDDLLQTPATPRRTDLDPLDIANIQFTSGTTGLPKGCLLTHEYWMEMGIFGATLNPDSVRLLADHPFYYMQNQAYLMVALFKGGALYITPGLSRRKFMNWLHDYRIDFAWIDEDLLLFPEDPRDKDLALTRAPVAGMPGEAYAPIEERFGIKARECYASTEIGSGTAVPFERDDLAGNGSMGFCFPNRESKIVDERFEEVPPGTAGELCFRGPGMMLGYHNRPEANAELFLPGGWFRTGDIAVKDADGQHFYIGRLRDMIRRSGENISAAELELHIGTMPGVDDIAAVPVPDPDREEEVKVIIVPEGGADLTADQVVAWAREGLAPFKVPRYVEFRTELPYTASGKIHKAALKEEPNPLHEGVIDTRL
ncbi:class I adenylate-forming enzyme family protein [Planomonospora sp. ID82291]|uniref:class I adenylate-forming enzyme family protein n=1 Tax=Planomonospora sp. ID82291 TaxID=2738136 RepID=UPI0018C388F0|nr:class I adenylate-forming enzyme family protein [Planomonospora sp. ID82291]MBG0817807.1 acyl--CoA ligase [Planomonospora sp. ID82291]